MVLKTDFGANLDSGGVKVSYNAFFRIREFFQSLRTKLLSLLYVTSLAYTIPYCLSPNHNPELRGVICTGVRPFSCTDILPLI